VGPNQVSTLRRSRADTEAILAEQIDHWNLYNFGCWVARRLSDNRMIGYLGLSVPTFLPEVLPAVEVGWRLDPGSWGKGYASEGATAALAEAFGTLGLDSVCSIPQTENVRSIRVAERLGMTAVREVLIPANERRGSLSAVVYEIDRLTWIGDGD
jgi:RimJ/RimL family protein N-acetyltransferase